MFKRIAITLAFLFAASLGITAPAQAAGNCDQGYSCIWSERSYGGKVYGMSYTYNSVPSALEKKGSSAGANGAMCKHTRYYDDYNYETLRPRGKYFTLNSQTLMKKNYRDPNLSNGVGFDGAGINWENRVHAMWHRGC